MEFTTNSFTPPAHKESIRFINFLYFKEKSCLSPYPTDKEITCSLEDINLEASLLVFVSHCWLRTNPNSEGWSGKSHPDNKNNDKFALLIDTINNLLCSQAPGMLNCYIWLDFGCIDQTLDPGR